MIRFVTPELEALFCEKSVQFGIFGAKIYSQYQTYGAQSGILDMWLLFDDTYVTGCVSRFGGLLTAACTPRADVEELAVFLRAVGGRAGTGLDAVFVDGGRPARRVLYCLWVYGRRPVGTVGMVNGKDSQI